MAKITKGIKQLCAEAEAQIETLTPEQAMVAKLAADLLAQGPMDLDGSSYFEQLQDLQASLSFSATVSLFKGKLVVPAEDMGEAGRLVGRTLAQPSMPVEKLLQSKKAREQREGARALKAGERKGQARSRGERS